MIITKLSKINPLPNYFKFGFHSVNTIGGSSPYNLFTNSQYGKLQVCSPYEIMNNNLDGNNPSSSFTTNLGDYFMFLDVKNPITGVSGILKSIRALLYAYEDISSTNIFIGITSISGSNLVINAVNKITLVNINKGYYDLATNINRDANDVYGNWAFNPGNLNNYWLTVWLPYSGSSAEIGVMMNTNYYMNYDGSQEEFKYNFPSVYNTTISESNISLNNTFDLSKIFNFNNNGVPDYNINNPSLALEVFDIELTEPSNWNLLDVAKESDINEISLDTSYIFNANEGHVTINNPTNIINKGVLDTLSNTLTNANDHLTIPTYDGSGQAMHPDVLYFKEGWNGYKYWMAMTPYTGGNSNYENPSIVASNDGITWEVPSGLTNPVVTKPSDGYNSDTELYFENNTLYLFWRKVVNTFPNYEIIYYKSSTDGINWSGETEIFSKEGNTNLLSPAIINVNGKYRIYVVRVDGTIGYLDYYESDSLIDGYDINSPVTCNLDFTPVNKKLWHINITPDNDKYLGIFTYCGSEHNGGESVLYFGESSDSINWNVNSTSLLLPSNSGGWDNSMIYRSSLVRVDKDWKLYYSADNISLEWYTGLIDIPENITSIDYSNSGIIEGEDSPNIYYSFNTPIDNLVNIRFKLMVDLSEISTNINFGNKTINIYVMINGMKKYIDTINIFNDFINNRADGYRLYEIYVGEENVQRVIFEFNDSDTQMNIKYYIRDLEMYEIDNSKLSDSISLTSSDFDDNNMVTLILKDNTQYCNTNPALIRVVGYNSDNIVIGASNPVSNRNKY